MKQWMQVVILCTFVASVSLVAGLATLGREQARANDQAIITVTGSVKKNITSDLAKWTASFSRQANTENLKTVIERTEADMEVIRSFVASYGIAASDVVFLPIQTDVIYEQLPNYGMSQKVVGYTVRLEARVESSNIEAIDKLATEAKKIIDLGVIPQYQRTEYFYTKLGDLRPELFAEATKDAKRRAEAVVSGVGGGVGEIRSAKTGLVQLLPPNSSEVVDWGAFDTSTKEKEVSATVTVSFSLEK